MGDSETEGSEVAQSPNRSHKPPFPFPGHLQGHRRCEKEREQSGQELVPGEERPPFSHSTQLSIVSNGRSISV